ncbi:DUF2254 domain-containing protein [Nonomuraea sp. NN258]|uniref:DUF2254 family protein n=1 Tax=Nonomuraea antri TaxID=2730852 RepID=UPI001569029D|nr:DUF2254 family protein [Nonomuraea antri]NRQ36703.1 DUF2254 domain-containing protein [Nonomuraea antri]
MERAAPAEKSVTPTLFRRPRRRLRAGLVQVVCAAAGLAAGLILPGLPPATPLPTKDVTAALFTIGFGVLGLASVIFSLLFLVMQFAAGTFSLRLTLFRDDPTVWRTFAFAVGLFIYTITAALVIAHRGDVSLTVPVLTVLLALVAALLMRTVQIRAFVSIQLAPCLNVINRRTRRVLDTVYRLPYRESGPAPPDLPARVSTIVWRGGPARLQEINVPALVAAAAERDAVIVLRVSLGAQLFDGDLIADVHGNAVPEPLLRRQVLTGAERSFSQDAAFGFRLLADIALRSLSASVNDPATTVQTLDHVHDLLRRLVDKDLDVGTLTGADGRVRLVIPLPGWEDYLRLALDEVIVAAAHSPMALVRLRDLLRDLRGQAPRQRVGSIAGRLARVEAALRTGVTPAGTGRAAS